MNITNWGVFGLEEALAAAKLPMMSNYQPGTHYERIQKYKEGLAIDPNKTDLTTQFNLGAMPANSGHANFCKSIMVSAVFCSTIKWWAQAQRYSHFIIGSSQSTVHKITKMDIDDVCSPRVLPEMKAACKMAIKQYNDGVITLSALLDNIPTGLQLAAQVSTNYLQLRTMYQQRKNHVYEEWAGFCGWIKQLPLADKLITVEDIHE